MRVLLGLALAGWATAQPVEVATLATPAPVSIFLVAQTGKFGGAVCDDHKVRMWTLPEGKLAREIDLGNRSLDVAVLSGDGEWIAVGDHSGLYTVWNASTGAEQLHVQMPYYPFAMAFSPDGKRLAIAPVGEPVQVYDVSAKKKLFELQRAVGGTQAVAFSNDGARIATADSDTVVRVYDSRNGELLARNADFLAEPLAASFTADGKHLLAAGADKIIAWLDASTGRVLRRSAKLADPVNYLEVSPDGKWAAAGLMHADNMLLAAPVIILETESGRSVQEWLPPSLVLGGRWTRDGHLLVGVGKGNSLHIWRVQ
jgi:WD40 repeat protein